MIVIKKGPRDAAQRKLMYLSCTCFCLPPHHMGELLSMHAGRALRRLGLYLRPLTVN
jgi:hypothetical protein